MNKKSKIDTDVNNNVELINRSDVEANFGEAIASIVSADVSVTWAKFVLTDDKPNGNNQRIPIEEFGNIIKTGIFKPVKMSMGEINDGHDGATPLGVITHLIQEDNKIIALAALWDKERADDVSMIKNLVKDNKPVNVSWEVLYGRAQASKGVSDLLDTTLRAVTIVGMPAYAGRTQFVAIASSKWNSEFIDNLPDTHFLYVSDDGVRHFAYRDETGKIDTNRFEDLYKELSESQLPPDALDGIKHQVDKMKSVIEADAGISALLRDGVEINLEDDKLDTKELETKVTDLTAKLAVASNEISVKEAALQDALAKAELSETALKELTSEIEPLREFKQEVDALAAKEEKLSAVKEKFSALKLEKPEEYFSDNAEKLLALDDAGLEFMLQEMVAFRDSEGSGQGSASQNSGIPNFSAKKESTEIKDIVAALRARKTK